MAIIDISKKTATDLLNPLTGQYFIPDNQRTFSWDDDQVEDLLQDIMTAYEDSIRGDDASHFMGMIVFYEDDQQNPKKLYIYDGQQRITNLILFFLACSRAYEDFGKKNDVENYKVFSNKIINRFALDEQAFGSNEEFVYTITLGNINNDFIKEYIYQNKPFPLVKKLPETNKLMRKAFMKYYDEINNLIAETTAIAEDVVEDVRKVISKLVHTISEEFLFLTVKTNDINQAYEIFETLNARGKELETADLLKNHLLMNAESRYKHNIQRNWDYIVDELISFKMNEVTRYIRYYWNSRYEFARERDLFRKLRTRYPARNVKEKENLVVNLKNYVTHYRNLIDEDYNGPYSANEVMKNAVLDLKQLGLLSHIPLILAISEQVDFFTDEDISKTMNYLINFMVRNIIIGKQTANRNEILFSSIAQRVSEGTIINVEGILSELQNNPNAITDDQFENLFNEYSTRNKNYIRYILRKFNNYLGKSALTLRSPNEVHIEHINPQTPRGESLADEKQYKDTLWRLGNLTFLLNSQNTSLSNKDYSEKKDSYRESELRITNIIPEQFDSWGYEQIFKRQRNMAKAAREIWKL